MKQFIISILLLSATTAFAGYESVYTSVNTNDCVTFDSSALLDEPEIDYYHGECPALAGYRVTISGGDIRYSLFLTYNGLSIPTVTLPNFHDLGSDKIEWRYERTRSGWNHDVEYKALIYRLSYSDFSFNGLVTDKSMLVVVRLDKEKSCVIGKVEQQKDMNVKARAIADDASAKCLVL